MSIEPHDWNIILIGYWNQAILTPVGIARRLFQLPVGASTFQVEVPIDGLAPYKVSHDGVSVLVANDRLEVKLNTPDFENLGKGAQIAVRALEDLKETPVQAAGLNLRYRVNSPDSELAKVTQASIDSLSDLGLEIKSWGLSRAIKFKDGVINLASNIETGGGHEVQFNFHRDSATPEKHDTIIKWLQTDIQEIKAITLSILNTIERQEG